MAKPDIQKLLGRHLYGTKAERAQLEEAMAGVKVTEELAREAVTKGLACVKAGNIPAAREAKAEADKWLKLQAKYRSCLTTQGNRAP